MMLTMKPILLASPLLLLSCSDYEFDPSLLEDQDLESPDVQPIDSDTGGFTVPERETPWDCYGRVEIDGNADGTPDGFRYQVYDLARQDLLLREEVDPRDDGILSWQADYEYDAAGNLTRAAEDDYADGAYDLEERWTHDESGNELTYWVDNDGDGAPDRTDARTYDAAGVLTTWSVDEDGDGTFERVRTYEYDENGRMVGAWDDLDGDEVAEVTYVVETDEQGRTTLFLGTDVATEAETYRYTSTWTPLEEPEGYERNVVTIDADGDGDLDQQRDYVYDSEGLLREGMDDRDGDDHFELAWREIEYDDAGRYLGYLYRSTDPDGSGLDAAISYVWHRPTGPWRDSFTFTYSLFDTEGAVTGTGGSVETAEWFCPAEGG